MRALETLLQRDFRPEEILVISGVLMAAEDGEPYRAGKLGIAQSLIDRHWLTRDDTDDRGLYASNHLRDLLAGRIKAWERRRQEEGELFVRELRRIGFKVKP